MLQIYNQIFNPRLHRWNNGEENQLVFNLWLWQHSLQQQTYHVTPGRGTSKHYIQKDWH